MFVFRKRFFLVLVVFAVLQNFCSAKIRGSRFRITESEKEFDIAYYLTPDLKEIEVEQNDDVVITKAFQINKDDISADVYYSLFTDVNGTDDLLMGDFAMWAFICLNNAVGYEVDLNSLGMYKDSDVQKEFNGDFGCFGFFKNPVSDFANGHKYIHVEFYYKRYQGMVMRSFLFDDLKFLGFSEDGTQSLNNLWVSNFHTFVFMEKNDKGEFVMK